MLSLHNISAGYHGKRVLQNVSIDIAHRDFLGIIGPNGCGKTTLLRLMTGTLPAQEGQVLFDGRNLRDTGRRQLARAMACLLQDYTIDFAFTVRDLALMGRSPHIPRFGRESQHDIAIVERAMKQADVLHLADRSVIELSGGERQRALIAMCLAQEPKLLLLDEPTSHLDLRHQVSILDLVADLNRETGLTVVAVFHDLNLAAMFCSRLVILNEGQIVACGEPERVLTADVIQKVFGVTVSVQHDPRSQRPFVTLVSPQKNDDVAAVRRLPT
jgi:iron complex transport system ATP-binding protein